MDFRIGDSVSALDEDMEGKILEILQDKIVVLTKEGFSIPYQKNELIKKGDSKSLSGFSMPVSEIIKEKETPKRKKNPVISKKERHTAAMEVDLHINQLVKNTKGMDNYDMLTLQLDTAKRQLEFAIQKRFQRIVFIHGVGEGVLRTEMEYLFKRYDNIKFYDADYQKYGRGATEVYIFQNTAP